MTHKYPAVLPPQAQETTRDIVVRLARYMLQQDRARQSAQALAEQLEKSNTQLRDKLAAMAQERRALCDILSANTVTIAGQTLADAMQSIIRHSETLERQLGETHLALTEAELRNGDAREWLAAYAHEAWSGWKEYEFSKGTFNDDGTWTCPAWAVERWTRQMNTPYADLTEEERASDRAEADKMLAVLNTEAERRLTESGVRG